jgi:precorrin-6B methylase 1
MQTQTGQIAPPPAIYIVGLGIRSVRQVTREAEDAIRASRSVLYVDAGFGVQNYLASLCRNVENLLTEYHEDSLRLGTYRAMAARVVEAALDDPPVTFAVYGHPTFFVYPAELIRESAALLGLGVEVLPGISCIDSVSVDLGLDVGTTGLQVHDATGLLLTKRRLDPEVPCLLLQVDALESGFFTTRRSAPERFRRLQGHLLEFYPPEHIVTTVRSSTFPLFAPDIEPFPISDLPERLAASGATGTLFIPPVSLTPFADAELAEEVNDITHLRRVTEGQAG